MFSIAAVKAAAYLGFVVSLRVLGLLFAFAVVMGLWRAFKVKRSGDCAES